MWSPFSQLCLLGTLWQGWGLSLSVPLLSHLLKGLIGWLYRWNAFIYEKMVAQCLANSKELVNFMSLAEMVLLYFLGLMMCKCMCFSPSRDRVPPSPLPSLSHHHSLALLSTLFFSIVHTPCTYIYWYVYCFPIHPPAGFTMTLINEDIELLFTSCH